jgi:hypothetical protein
MKTKIIGMIAIGLAISLNAFTNPNRGMKFGTGPYWFLINDGTPKGTNPVPASDATFIQQSTTPPNQSSTCPGGANQCLSGFNASQVNPATEELIDDEEVSVYQKAFQN